MDQPPAPTRPRLALSVFIFFTLVYMCVSPGHVTGIDTWTRWRMARNLWTQGTVSVKEGVLAAEYRVKGRTYSSYGVGQPILIVPFDMVALPAGRALYPDHPEWFVSLSYP